MTDKEVYDFLKESKHSKQYFSLLGPDSKDFGAFKYIIENKPKFVLEYGGGRSTWVLTLLINELNYGGKIVGIENQEFWYNDHVNKGLNEFDNIILIEEYEIDDDKFTYVHDMEPYKDVDFVIIDGPDYRLYGDKLGITTNLELLVNYTNKKIPYFIDGRSGTVEYYQSIGYEDYMIEDRLMNI
jgi:hypothetical protein